MVMIGVSKSTTTQKLSKSDIDKILIFKRFVSS